MPLPTHRTTVTQNRHTRIHTLIGIRTHDPSVRASEYSSCLRPRGHCDRTVTNLFPLPKTTSKAFYIHQIGRIWWVNLGPLHCTFPRGTYVKVIFWTKNTFSKHFSLRIWGFNLNIFVYKYLSVTRSVLELFCFTVGLLIYFLVAV
jgi:hypothetical protein